jgi:uncharacterized SAM-binding protein YcdF (DUF218 family)
LTRLVAVLGYSAGRTGGLHAVCARRLAHAEGLADGTCTVVLSGEAELMRAAWKRREVELVCDTTARNTAQNAAGIAEIARRVGATEVVLVTSRWHARRATLLVRAALRGRGIAVRTSSPNDPPGARLLFRELACLAVAPFQAARLRLGCN